MRTFYQNRMLGVPFKRMIFYGSQTSRLGEFILFFPALRRTKLKMKTGIEKLYPFMQPEQCFQDTMR